MMKKPSNWNEIQEFSEARKLPVGAQVVVIHQAMVEQTQYGEQLFLAFEISEGEYKGFYREEYNASTLQDKKWKGVLRQFLPKDDGSEKDEWTKRSLKGFVSAVERSNPGFMFDWNEQSLVGKCVGILYRNEEWEYNGKTGWSVRPFRAISADSARHGEYEIPKDKPLKKTEAPAYGQYTAPSTSGYGGFSQNPPQYQAPSYQPSYPQTPAAPAYSNGFRPLDDSGDEVPF